MKNRIQPKHNPSPEAQTMLDAAKKQLGMVPNLFQTLAHSPAALEAYLSFNTALSKSKISAALREQLALTVAAVNGCDYCASAHTALGKMAHVDEAELTCNLAGVSNNPKTQAALTFAKQVVKERGQVKDADLAAVRDAGYSDAEVVEIISVVAVNIFTNYFNHIAGTEIDFPRVNTAVPV